VSVDTTRLAAALADRYRIEHELGQGGMATVYLAMTSSTTAKSPSRFCGRNSLR
jgi:hypothetical protein